LWFIVLKVEKFLIFTKNECILTKEEKYLALLPQLESLLEGEPDPVARMANLAALLHREMGFWWTGFYRVQGEELVLGPFQGPVACTRIAFGRGVCGTAWKEQRTVVVPDVEEFPGHIACSSESRSEIVVPLWHQGTVAGVLDIDSRELNTFDDIDRRYLEKAAALVFGPQRDIWLAAGCFWGAQKFFKQVEGVDFTEVGFCNGWVESPTYEQVYTDRTGHAECVHVRYDPERVSLQKLVRLFFMIIDPLSLNKQGEDEGTRYRTGVYYGDERDLEVLQKEFRRVEKRLGVQSMPVELLPLKRFFRAEEYHQDYLEKNPNGYCHLSPALFKKKKKV
jgi:methionine-S-sulfoxide reductase